MHESLYSLEKSQDSFLYNEDCYETTKRFPEGSIDLIYADPPFFSGRVHSLNNCVFDDRWISNEEYINWIRPRLAEFRRVLKSTGSIYIHCDWHISHYLKVLADTIFHSRNFVNEVIWKRQSCHNDYRQGSRHFGRIHDTILVYAKSKDYVWNSQFIPYEELYIKNAYRHKEKETGRKFALGDLTGPGGKSNGNPKYKFLGTERYWRYSKSKMLELLANGRIAHKDGRVPLLKRYLDEMPGKPVQDLWFDIKPCYNRNVKFPTQKPKALLQRIISTSSNLRDIVYDPFAGSGTSGVVSLELSRRWIASEISIETCSTVINRLGESGFQTKLHDPNESIEDPINMMLQKSSIQLRVE